MASYLNQDLGFDEVRWATMRKTSYDSGASFRGMPRKALLPHGTRLYRLLRMATGMYFTDVWWMPANVYKALHDDAVRSRHGGGKLFRNYVVQYMALPSADCQLCVVEIELTESVYAWVGQSSALFERPGGMEQVFLPNLAERGSPRTSGYARVLATYWLRF
jgi:hypothetical protein